MPFDGLDPAEFVEIVIGYPAIPKSLDHLLGHPVCGSLTDTGQPQLISRRFGQAAGLQDERPSERTQAGCTQLDVVFACGFGSFGIEVSLKKDLAYGASTGLGDLSRAIAGPNRTGIHQAKHCRNVMQRRFFRPVLRKRRLLAA